MPGGSRRQMQPRAAILVAAGERFDHIAKEIGLHGIVKHCQSRCGASDNALSSQRRPGMRQSG